MAIKPIAYKNLAGEIRILKDGSLSKTKITKANIIPDSVIRSWD